MDVLKVNVYLLAGFVFCQSHFWGNITLKKLLTYTDAGLVHTNISTFKRKEKNKIPFASQKYLCIKL